MFGELKPWIAGDPSTLAAWENDQEEKVYLMLEYFKDDRWRVISSSDVDEAIRIFDIDYVNLPQWLKDEIDTINIV